MFYSFRAARSRLWSLGAAIMALRQLRLRNVVSGGSVAELEVLSSWGPMEVAVAVAERTGHNDFKLLQGGRCFFPSSVTELGEFAGEGDTGGTIDMEILVQDVPTLRITGIPCDTLFGGHGPAVGSTAGSPTLQELNGDWLPVPLLRVRGHPIWRKSTALRNQWQDRGMPADDGVRYIVLGGDGVLDIAWLPAGEVPREHSFPHQSSRHGFLSGVHFKEVSPLTCWEKDGLPCKAKVSLAIKPSRSFPHARVHSWRVGENVVAGEAELVRREHVP